MSKAAKVYKMIDESIESKSKADFIKEYISHLLLLNSQLEENLQKKKIKRKLRREKRLEKFNK
jgi:hypothetical protein